MLNAHEIATRIDPARVPVTAQAQAPKQIDEASALVINAVFRELQSCCPAWRQAWPDDKALAAAKKSWTKAFMAAGLRSIEQVRLGIEQLLPRSRDTLGFAFIGGTLNIDKTPQHGGILKLAF